MLEVNGEPIRHEKGLQEFTRLQKSAKTTFINSLFANVTTSVENNLNDERLCIYKNKFTSELLTLINDQEFEFGIDTPADKLLRQRMSENTAITKEWLNGIYNNEYANISIIIGILKLISHFDYSEIEPQGITMALSAIPHANSEVKECGVRALENWGTPECLAILKNIHCEEGWLKEYVNQVISDIEEDLQ